MEGNGRADTAPRAAKSAKVANAGRKPNRAELRLGSRGNFLAGRVVRHWNKAVVESLPLKCSRTKWVWHLGTWAGVGLGSAEGMVNSVLRRLFQAKRS